VKTREQIIESMCLTWRHDYGLDKNGSGAGMTNEERETLRSMMGQIFDNDIAPHMEFRKESRKTELVHDGIIKIHSFELTEREQKRISLGLKYGPDSAAMKDDGTFWESESAPKEPWRRWLFKKFLGKD
jgi:hypothetical protein